MPQGFVPLKMANSEVRYEIWCLITWNKKNTAENFGLRDPIKGVYEMSHNLKKLLLWLTAHETYTLGADSDPEKQLVIQICMHSEREDTYKKIFFSGRTT